MSEKLNSYKKDITSQNGEDGIIEEIFNRISPASKICIEFGAWDGKHLSNVWNLWHNKGWKSILIEADNEKFKTLRTNVASFSDVRIVNSFVEPEGVNCLDSILSGLNVSEKVDLLSIDIDGNDYYIFQSLRKYKPRVILIEYNPTIPPTLNIVQGQNEYFGASALAIKELANSKGYHLAAITDTNLIFVSAEDFPKLNVAEVQLEQEFPGNHLVYAITTYDGHAYLSKELPFLYKMNTLNEEVTNGFRINSYLRRMIMRLFRSENGKHRPKLNGGNNIVPVRIFKDN